MNKKIVASIEARMTSSRLPGKIMLKCLNKPLLALLVERVSRSHFIDEVVVSTTTNSADKEIVECTKKLNIGCYRGSEIDVLKRVVEAMQEAHADIVVHLTGDNPLIDPEIIDQLIKIYIKNKYDYVSNMRVRSYPIGLDTQVTSLTVLKESLRIAADAPQHEHVCLSIYENKDIFKLYNLIAPPKLFRPELRWTVDTKEDYQFIKVVYENLYPQNPNFTSLDIIRFLDLNKDMILINSGIKQKKAR